MVKGQRARLTQNGSRGSIEPRYNSPVMALVVRAQLNKQVAAEPGISEITVNDTSRSGSRQSAAGLRRDQ